MFTGIIEEIGQVEAVSSQTLKIKAKLVLEGTKLGDSIAVNGVCLTVTNIGKNDFTVDVMPETFRRTSLGFLRKGNDVNLERALSLNDRLGGHLVSGHVDDTGKIIAMTDEGNAIVLTVECDKNILRFIAEKGSVALDGISLTVVKVNENSFSVSLIPHTREITTFKDKKTGDALNIEVDLICRYVERLLQDKSKSGEKRQLTQAYLMKCGF